MKRVLAVLLLVAASCCVSSGRAHAESDRARQASLIIQDVTGMVRGCVSMAQQLNVAFENFRQGSGAVEDVKLYIPRVEQYCGDGDDSLVGKYSDTQSTTQAKLPAAVRGSATMVDFVLQGEQMAAAFYLEAIYYGVYLAGNKAGESAGNAYRDRAWAAQKRGSQDAHRITAAWHLPSQ